MVTEVKEYISDISFQAMLGRKKAGRLERTQIRTPLWLRGWQAKELGFNAGEEDFLLEPLEPEEGALFGRIKQQPIPTRPTPTAPAIPKETPVAPTTPSLPPIEPSEQWPETFEGMPLAEAQRLGIYPTPNYIVFYPDGSVEYVEMFWGGGLQRVQNKGGEVYKLPPRTITPLTSARVQPTLEEENPIIGLLRKVYPSFGLSEANFLNDINQRITEDPDKFLEDLRLRGKSADTIQVLQMFSSEPLTQEDVDNFFGKQPMITPEQNLMMKALPLLVNPRTIDWANKYFSSPDKLRRELVTVGRNPDTVALVKSKFPNISEQGLKDYFSQDFRPPAPLITTPLGRKVAYPMTDAEWNSMPAYEKEFYRKNPQVWLENRDEWVELRMKTEALMRIGDILGINLTPESTGDNILNFISLVLLTLGIPGGRLAAGVAKKVTPTIIKDFLAKIASIKIGGKGVKVTSEVAERVKAIAKEPLPEAPKVKPPEITPTKPAEITPTPTKGAVVAPEKVTPEVTIQINRDAKLRLNTLADKSNLTVEMLKDPSSGLSTKISGDPFTAYDYALAQSKQEWTDLNFKRNWKKIAEFIDKDWGVSRQRAAIPKAEIPKVGKIIPEKGIPEVKQTEFVNKYVESKGAKLPPPVEPPVASVQMPSNMSASQQVAKHISFDPDKIGLREKFLRGKNKAMSQWIDKLYPIDTFTSTAKKLGAKISLEENPYIQARLLEGVVSKATTFLEEGTFGRTFWKMEKGKAIPNFKGRSFSQILDEVKEPEAWRDFSTYLTSLRAKELEALGIKTGIEKDVAIKSIAELETKYPRFVKLSEDIQKYQSDLLDYIQESGLISAELRKTLESKYASYVPFHRVLEELQGKGYMGKKMVDIASPIKRIKGSEREIINPLESITKNTYAFLSAADRNEVGVAMARLVHDVPELAGLFEPIKTPIAKVATVTAKELGMSVEGLSDDAMEGVFNIFRPSMFTPDDVVTVLIDGKKQFFRVDPDLKTALTAMDTANMGMLWKVLSSPAKWLRAGATLSPDFAIRNPLRDQQSAIIYSNYGFIPGVDFLKGIAHIIKKDATYKLYKMSGAERSMLVSLDREYLAKSFKEVVEGKKFTDYVKHPLELLQIASELGEKATRLGEFAKGIKRGTIPLEAGFSAREVTLDFAKAGTQAKAVNQIIAFFNAQIRDPDRMIQAFKEHPIRTSTKIFAFITLPSLSLWAANHDDPRWKEIPQWQKDLSWIIFAGPPPKNYNAMTVREKEDYFSLWSQLKSGIYRIPKPFGLGQLFGSAPERLLDYLETKDPTVITKFLGNFFQSAMPGLIPTGAEPVIENITNHSFFRGTPVVPESKQDLPPELQYTEYTSEVAKRMGRLLKQSPMKIDNILYGWTGGLGRYATEAIDKVLEKTGIVAPKIEPSPTLADIPVVRAFVVRNPIGGSSASVSTFYDELDSYTSIEKLLKGLIEDGKKDEFEKEKAKHPELLFAYDEKGDTYYSASARYLRRVSGELSDIRKLQDKIYKSTTMTPEKKRELIDALDVIKTEMARRALELIRNPSKEVGILEIPVKDIEGKMGIASGSPLSEDIVKLTDIASDLAQAKGESPLKKLLERNNTILVDIANLPDTPLYQIDRATTKAGLTRRQNELLDQYESATDKKAFLVEHPELKENPKQKWLRDNPEANAILALWGNSKILTQKAYDIAIGLVERNDIPNNALEERILPPKGLAVPYFDLMEAKEKFGDSSWEAKLILAKNKGLVEWNPSWTLPDTPIASLELKTEKTYRETYNKLNKEDDPDWVGNLDDKIKDKDGKTARDRAIAELKATKIGDFTWIDIDRKVKAIEKGFGELGGKINIVRFPELGKELEIDKSLQVLERAKGTHISDDDWDKKWRANYDEMLDLLNLVKSGDAKQADVVRVLDLMEEDYWLDHDAAATYRLPDNYNPQKAAAYEAISQAFLPIIELYKRIVSKLPQWAKEFTPEEWQEQLVEFYVERGRLIDKEGMGASSAEVMLQRVDNPDFNKWLMDKDIWGDDALTPIDTSRIPIWRIDVKYRKEDAEYKAILDKYEGAEETQKTADYMAGVGLTGEVLTRRIEYRKDDRRRQGYGLTNSKTGEKLPTTEIENYVTFYEIPDIKESKRRERFAVENPEFAAVMYRITGKDIWLTKAEDVPNVAYDDIYDKYKDLFDELNGLSDFKSDYYIKDDITKDPITGLTPRETRRQEIYDENPAFKEAYYRRQGYELLLADEYVDDYTTYMVMPEKGWGKERYLKLHPEFFDEIQKIKEEKEKSPWMRDIKWDEIPSEKVEALWFEYDAIPTQLDKQQQDFRIAHPDLDAWMVLTGKVKRLATEERRRTKLTPREKSLEDIFVRQSEFEKKIAELRKKLGGL